MDSFIKFTDHRGVKTMINISHIKTAWEQNDGRTSFHMQGDKPSEIITADIPFNIIEKMLEVHSWTPPKERDEC